MSFINARVAQFEAEAPTNIVRDGLNSSSAFYVLNPSLDLEATEKGFLPLFSQYGLLVSHT
jgi:hypothetical protein